MAPRTILAQLVVALKDDASKGAKNLSSNLKDLERNAVDFAKTMQGAKWGSAFTRDLGKLKATSAEIDQIKKSWSQLQAELGSTKNAKMRTDAARAWANDWRNQLAAVRIAQQQHVAETLADAKRRAAEEKKIAATTARDQLRTAVETAREKAKIAREASAAERQAAQESARVAREAARDQARAARQAAREARAAAREASRAEREHGRGAGAMGRAIFRNTGYALGIGGGGYLTARGARATARAGGESLREDARDYLAGLPPEQSERLRRLANEQSQQYKSLTATSLHGLYRESATTALGEEGTRDLAPALAQAQVVMQSLKGRDEALRQLTGFMRGLDTLGKNVDSRIARALLEGSVRAAGVQGVEYNPRDIFTLAKQARSGGGALSVEFLSEIAPSLMADMGPSAPGTAIATLNSSVIGGTLSAGNSRKKMAEQTRLGLRQKNGQLTAADRDLIAQNPHLYAWNRLAPALQASGVDTKNEAAVSEALNKLYTRTVADLFGKLITQQAQYQLTQDRMRKSPGLAAADELAKRDPFVAAEGVTAQLTNVAEAISRPILDTINPALTGLAGTLGSLAQAIRNDPQLAKMLGIGVAAGAGVVGTGAAVGALNGAIGGTGMIGGALVGAGRALPLLARGGGLLGLGYGGYQIGSALGEGINAIGSVAAGANYTPGDAESVFGLADRLGAVEREISGIKDRTHPSRAGEPNADLSRLEAEAQDLRNRITAGTAGAGGDLTRQLADEISAGRATVEAAMEQVMEAARARARSGITVPINVVPAPSAGGDGGTAPARASGGSVSAGGLYRVNEYGEEFFQPMEDGRIIDPRRRAAGDGGGRAMASISISPTFNIASGADAKQVAQETMAELESTFRETMRSAFADYGVEVA
uniref:Phage tail tape measure protein n=1 Tax=Bosea sp. NBC_00436 TaxID=2969620 RepID=A0A9E7ZXX5_9HYPH